MQGASMGFGGGKVILLGEHAVVHGSRAIAAGLPCGVSAVARRAKHDALHIAPWGRSVCPNRNSDDPLSRALAEALASYAPRPSLEIDVRVDLPPGAGLGCSAALGVAVLDAIDRALGVERTRHALGAKALEWERLFHGAPSGVDNTVAALGGLILFEPEHGATNITPRQPLHLVIANSDQRSDTKDMVARVASRLAEAPRRARELLEEVSALVAQGESAIREGDLRTLGLCLDRNHEVLRGLDLSTARIEALIERGKSAGALGAKVTGAGGGGCIVALAANAREAARIATELGDSAFAQEVGHAA